MKGFSSNCLGGKARVNWRDAARWDWDKALPLESSSMGWRAEEIGGGDGHGGRMGRDEVDLLLVSVVAWHVGQVGWVFVHGGFGGMGLQGLSDAVEVKLVGVTLAVHFGHDVFVVVVAQGAA